MRMSDWGSYVLSTDLLEDSVVGSSVGAVHDFDKRFAVSNTGRGIADIGVKAQIAKRYIIELQLAAPQQCVEILVHRRAVADLRDLIVLVVIKEGAEVDRHSAAEQRVLHADIE